VRTLPFAPYEETRLWQQTRRWLDDLRTRVASCCRRRIGWHAIDQSHGGERGEFSVPRELDYSTDQLRQGISQRQLHLDSAGSTVDQLVDWRMEKKQHMRWTKTGAHMLLHARCALMNGELGKYTGWSSTDSSLEQAVAA